MMKASPRRILEPNTRSSLQSLVLAAAVALPGAFAGVVINENATWPADPAFTTFVPTAATIESERDVRFNRNLAQTFQLATPLKLDKLYIDYEEGIAGKQVTVRIFSVANVNAGTLIQPETGGFSGTVFLSHDITTTDAINVLDGGNDPLGVLEIDLTDADEITLPATSGTEGYCFQIVRSGPGSTQDVTEERAFKWHWNDEDNLYANGRGYAVNGGTIGALDDFVFAIDAPDQTPPTIVDVRANAAGDRLTVVFSEGMDATSVSALANYSASSGLTLTNPEILSPTMVRFTTTAQTAGAEYVLTVNNVKDDAPVGNTIAPNSQFTFKALTQATGFLTAEFYHNIEPRSIDVATLVDWLPYSQNAPDAVIYLPNFSTPNGYGNDYGARIHGVLTPKESGNYTFFIRSDDNSALYINTTGPALPVPGVDDPIALELDCCDAFQEPETGDLATSAPIALTAGQRYGIVYLLREAGGGDFGMVAWRKEGDTSPAASLTPLPGTLFDTFVDATGSTLTITTHPASTQADEGLSATFTVEPASSVPANLIGYQWFKNGVEIPGATGATYTRSPILDNDHNANFTVKVRVPGIELTSNPATLTVNQDTVAPTIVGAKANADRLSVNITFSENIDAASLTPLSNFSISPALTISAAEVDGAIVQLTTSEQAIGTEYTITINNLKDFAGNSIAANSEVKFLAVGPLVQGDNGYVIWEAENYDRLLGTLWRENTVAGQPSGGVSMEIPNGLGATEYGDHLEYDILFTKTGRHLIWVRAGADNSTDAGTADSVWLHVYPKDTPATRPTGVIDRTASNDAGLTGFSGGNPNGSFVWARNAQSGISPMDFDIPTPGVYTIGIGNREDGAFVDKFIITQNPNFTPTGLGPDVTPRQGEPPPPPADLTITQHPTSQTVFQNLPVTFTVAATSSDPLLAYQWQRKVNDVFQDIPGATGASFTLNPATSDWNGAVIRAKVMVTGNTQFSNEAILTVLVDSTAPTVTAARGRSDLIALTVVFSENMDTATLQNLANFSIAGLNLQDATVLAGGRAVRFTTDPQTVGTEYTLTINGAKDLAQNSVAANTQVKFFGVGPLQQRADGYVVWEAEDYDRLVGQFWREIVPTFAASSSIAMEVPNNVSDTEYGDHLEYDINFTQAGVHTIYIRARGPDTSSDSAWLHVYAKDTTPTRPTGAIDRTASTDASMSFGTGDFTWSSNAQTGPDPMTFDIPTPGIYTVGIGSREDGAIVDKFMIRVEASTFVPTGFGPPETPRQGEPNPPADLTITTQPSNVTVLENRAAQFSIAYTSSDPFLGVQWQQKVGAEFQDITGATGATYTIDPATADMNGTVYRVRFTLNGQDTFSNEATLTVEQDTAAPVAQSAGAFANGTSVGVSFNEALNPAALGTYTVNGAAVTTATLFLERYVRLDLATPLTAPFTVSVTGAQDLEGNAAGAINLNGTISNLSSQILGDDIDPVEGGDTFTWGTGYYVTGGGSDIWGAADHGFFVYKQFTGAFDVRARVDDLVGGDEWGKAMLMARESLNAGSRNQGVLITKTGPFIAPTTGGMNVYNMQRRDTTDGNSGSTAAAQRISPTVFPSWIRLVRESATSNEMKSYVSYNGTDWILLDTHTTPAPDLPASLYLGMAVTSHDNAAGFPRAEVAYENFSIAPFGNVPFEPNLRVSQSATGIRIEWTQGTLVSSPTVNGAYTPVANATSPHDVTPGDTMRFFQVTNP